jgi:hypothetical protein
MFFDEDEMTSNHDDFSACLGIEDFLCGRDFGRDRGECEFSPLLGFPLTIPVA